MNFSPYQQAIFDAISSTEENILVEAVAGSGKTTTIVEAAKLISPFKRSMFLAFNKNIASELSVRLPSHVQAKTLHSLGWSICKENLGWFKTNDNKVRNILYYTVNKFDSMIEYEKKNLYLMRDDLCTYTSLLKAYCVGTGQEYDRMLPVISEHYGLDFPEGDFASNLRKTYIESISYRKVLDFDDMIYFPTILNDIKFDTYDCIFVDEAQDLSEVQIKFIKKLLSPKGRVILVGDRHQAIYGFNGANVDSMDRVKAEFNCRELPLSISYRCPVSVVNEAKLICSQIEASPTAKQGSVCTVEHYEDHILDGDFLICRTIDPLKKALPKLLHKGRLINFCYPDLINKMVTTVNLIQTKYGKINSERLSLCKENEIETFLRRGQKQQAGQVSATYELLEIIISLFPSESNYQHIFNTTLACPQGVKLMSLHKAKGLEAKRVFLLNPDDIPHKNATKPWEITQEYNLKYVAITRAKEELTYAKE
jgi:superfamily I DNA/RNA helicase